MLLIRDCQWILEVQWIDKNYGLLVIIIDDHRWLSIAVTDFDNFCCYSANSRSWWVFTNKNDYSLLFLITDDYYW